MRNKQLPYLVALLSLAGIGLAAPAIAEASDVGIHLHLGYGQVHYGDHYRHGSHPWIYHRPYAYYPRYYRWHGYHHPYRGWDQRPPHHRPTHHVPAKPDRFGRVISPPRAGRR